MRTRGNKNAAVLLLIGRAEETIYYQLGRLILANFIFK